MRALLLLIGVLFLSLAILLIANRYTPILPTQSASSLVIQPGSTLPTHVQIESNGPQLELLPAKIENSQWETTESGVSILTNPEYLGLSKSTMVLYGHNWPRLFGPLHTLKKNSTISVKIGGRWKQYEVSKTHVVAPTDLGVLYTLPPDSIVMYTCTGILDRKRLIVLATPLDTHE